jgi:hypothetical protein
MVKGALGFDIDYGGFEELAHHNTFPQFMIFSALITLAFVNLKI